jgi:hypothetical protein
VAQGHGKENRMSAINASDRHPATQQVARWFDWEHLPEGPARDTSKACGFLAADIIAGLPDGPELTTGLRKLLEAKDCFVRAAIAATDGQPS